MNKVSLAEHGTRPLVAIVGRPNVGKSTLFNRLAGQPTAIVSDISGTTRDRVTAESVWGEDPLVLVDTGGLDLHPETELWQKIKNQIDVAIAEADVIIMLADAHAGVTAADIDVADALRRSEKPVVLAANKADNELREAGALDFYKMGLGTPIPISAYHNRGIEDLMAQVIDRLAEAPPIATVDADVRLAIVGRTNVGKSTLLNAICGHERAIVSEVPGTTRDAVDTLITYKGRSLLLIDTAGIRRRGRIEPGIERYSVLRAIRAIERANVAIVLMEPSELATSQDAHIGGYVLNSYKGIVLAINKWDMAAELGMSKEEALKTVRERFRFASFAPACFVSALSGLGIEALLKTATDVRRQWGMGVGRRGLSRTIMEAVAAHSPASSGRRALKIYGVSQDSVEPPSFTFHVNRGDMAHFSYRRYLENAVRRAYGFEGSPLKMRFKGRGER